MSLFNFPKFDPPQINPDIFLDLRDPDEVTNNILNFLKEQNANAERQFKTSRNLVIVTIVIMILQIGYVVWTNSESNNKQNNLTKIIEMQSQQSGVISDMSSRLLDLQNQVNILEKEKVALKQKTSENLIIP